MLQSLSALALITIILGSSGWTAAQCPPASIGVYFDAQGSVQSVSPVQHQNMVMYVILFAEAPIGGAAWRIEMTSPHYSDPLVGPAGPNCQPPYCSYQDPPFWRMGIGRSPGFVCAYCLIACPPRLVLCPSLFQGRCARAGLETGDRNYC